MDAEAAGPSSSRGSRRRPEGEKRKLEECEGEGGTGSGKRKPSGEGRGSGRKRQRAFETSAGVGSWICRESYCGLSLPDQSSLERHYRGHCAQEEEKLARVRVKRRREEGEEEEGGLRQSRRLVLDRLRERRDERREGRLRDQQQIFISRECPLCRREVENDLMEDHLALCLRVVVPAGGEDEDDYEDEDVDVVDDDGWEEYEWAGQRRVRSSSLRLARRQECSSNQVTIQRTEEEEELDILGDDDEDKQGGNDDQTAREPATEEPVPSLSTNHPASVHGIALVGTQFIDDKTSSSSTKRTDERKPDSRDDLDLSSEEKGEMCKICMSCFSRPLVSTSCWHVHCQTCWLRALGTARVCPQCKAPVKPDDLSRVFL